MRTLSIVILAGFATGCAGMPRADTEETRLAHGRTVFEQTCATCHTIDPPPLTAPPMSHVARHYLEAIPERTEAARRIARWIGAPSVEESVLPAHAIERHGLMPPLALSQRDREAVAMYVLTLADAQGGRGMGGMRGAGMGMGGGAQHRHGQQEAIPPGVEQRVTAVGEKAAAALRTGLIGRLTAALAEGGPAGAIDVCALEAMPLTDSIAAAGDGIALKRTATRVRNPLNAPDELERAALTWFESELAAGRTPAAHVQRDGADFRYYAPLRVAALCLNCHGPVETLSSDVRRALQSRYPGDQATGYAEGDLRGLIRVSVPATVVRPGM
jgi:mono/diheme cytochrome c family protein